MPSFVTAAMNVRTSFARQAESATTARRSAIATTTEASGSLPAWRASVTDFARAFAISPFRAPFSRIAPVCAGFFGSVAVTDRS